MPHRDTEHPTIKLLRERASCRNFADRPVPDALLEEILDAAIHGPNGGNLQAYSIIEVREPATRSRLAELCGKQAFIAKAPVNLVFCVDWHRIDRWAELETAPFTASESFRMFWVSIQDAVICAQNTVTAADALGLRSVYVGMVMQCFRDLRDLFHLPDGVLPVVLLCLGYPETPPRPSPKLSRQWLVHREAYQQPSDEDLLTALREKHAGDVREISDARMAQIAKVCRAVHGEEFAVRCAERIEQEGRINAAQSYFALRYPSDRLAANNDRFLEEIESLGFGWFRPYVPHPRPD